MTLNLGILALSLLLSAPVQEEPIHWEGWSNEVFERAGREHRLVLLDLEAVWCHWCHVMAETTYRDPKVVGWIRDHYIAVRVDQDARPDLSNRYEDYGWPATVLFDPSGRELVKFAGYIPPPRMASLLAGTVEDPTPGPSIRTEADLRTGDASSLPEGLKTRLQEMVISRYDTEHEGWGFVHKYLDWDSVEYSLGRARSGDAASALRARHTLDAQLKLVDPAWGGVYQYSDGGTWENPHFEKIMSMQAENLRIYALAYAQWQDPRYLQAAREIHRYLETFLKSPEGAFYTSQDADVLQGEHAADYFALGDTERRKRGIPRVDKHLYARENAWAGAALVALSDATGEGTYLSEALEVARWIQAHRALPKGGFRHDERDAAGPYLGDTLAAGRFFLSLYRSSSDREWLEKAEAAASFIDETFTAKDSPGFLTARPAAEMGPVRPEHDENVALVRYLALLYEYSGAPRYRSMAARAMQYLTVPEIALRPEVAGVLLADEELGSSPLHVAVVGPRNEIETRALLKTALAYPSSYKRVEIVDSSEGPPERADVQYPASGAPAAYVCSGSSCSFPSRTPLALKARLDKLSPAGQPTSEKANP